MMEELQNLRKRWHKELFSEVLPFWLKFSLDKQFGGYFTCIDENNDVLDTTKYHWLQGRQVWMFSKIYNYLPYESQEQGVLYFDAAMLGAKFMEKAKDMSTGHLYFSTTRCGEKIHFQRKPYAAVFYSLGLLEMHKAMEKCSKTSHVFDETGMDSYYDEARKSFDLLLEWIDDPTLLGRPMPSSSLVKEKKTSLADIMCVCSLALEFYEYIEHTPNIAERDDELSKYRSIMVNACEQVRNHFHHGICAFLENAGPNGVDESTPSGRIFNPGHSIECSWFLLHVVEKVPNIEVKEMALKSLKGALSKGWDIEYGGIFYMMDTCGKPLLDATVTADAKLWWPLCEALYATLKAYAVTKEMYYFRWTKRIWEYMEKYLIDKVNGGEWWGYLNRDGSVFNKCKGGTYKGCFHVPRALLFCIQTADEILKVKTNT